ncbi:helix-turn-helix transcriptional regulator [Sedimentibacter sp. zth1]|uniref:helix-turn-helix domain-containing protein n=1 Tax=Sedimentibacter sp. zth1 TaxID=2816908 RepID=UPI001A91718B|nr:helix-turn-helix transcriptional regulator [Sedimentibacter sp. zth1]QSX05556.1 helix-turn-helix transcriptional regulator [Sedimentibacter sp. zth1]
MENTFGDFLKNLRNSYKLTRKKLCSGICSEKQLERIEKNINEPSVYILHHLSAKFNIDLNKFYKNFYHYECFEDHEYCNNIISCIKKLDFTTLYAICKELEKKPNFKKGTNFAHLCYGKAAYEFYINEEYYKTIEICIEGIQEESPNFTLQKVANNIYSDIGYSMLNLICGCYRKLDKFEESKTIAQFILNSIEKFYFSQSYQSYYSISFITKLYQTILCQIVNTNYNLGHYNEALKNIEKCLSYSFDNNMSRLIASLFQLKYLTLYKLGDYNGAREAYQCSITLYKNSNKEKIAIEMEEKAKKEFPKIFDQNSN